MAVLEGYFDESERPNGTFCVAGYVFAPTQAARFSREWHRLMDPYWPFHMSEAAQRKDKLSRPTKFESLSIEQRDALIRKAVEIINHRTSVSISIACNVRDVELAPMARGAHGGGLESAYSLCCYVCPGSPTCRAVHLAGR